jgi:hypothetical protein
MGRSISSHFHADFSLSCNIPYCVCVCAEDLKNIFLGLSSSLVVYNFLASQEMSRGIWYITPPVKETFWRFLDFGHDLHPSSDEH